jgi:anaerobic magnesium-protoporphyrin IX monomethyl ester cyclase
MKVVFVLPPFNLSDAYGSTRRMKRGFLPSLGVGYLAGMLEKHGHTCSLVDAQVTDLGIEETVDAVLAADPDVVAISAMSVYAHTSYALAQELKARAPEVFVVLGGPHATSFNRQVAEECPGVDVVVPGEGEVVLAELVDRLSRKEPWKDVDGIIFRDADGRVVTNRPARVVEDLDELPHPSRALFDPYPYRPLPNQVRREPATTSITSRGCSWGKCTFCYQGGEFSPAYRRRSPGNVIEEIAYLVRERGYREIVFWDDTFAVNWKWIDEFCDLLDRERLDIRWSCYGHMRGIRREMLRRMAKSGCYNLYYGFESGVQEILDLIKKGTTREQIRETVRWAKEAGMEIRGSFILGFPTETPEMTKQTIDFACELNVDWMMFYPFHVSKGTAIEELARADGSIVHSEGKIHFPSFVPSGYSDPEQLAEMVRLAYRRYYLRPRYIAQALWNCRRPSTLRNYFEAFRFWLDLTRGNRTATGEASLR